MNESMNEIVQASQNKVRVHFKKFITLFLFVIEIICKNV